MSAQPQISVCIPCYNEEEFIAAALESVLRQNFTDFEIVIADNQSSDRTVSVIKRFRDPRIRFIQNESNLGMAGNWLKVMSCSRGKYVKLLCGDDLLYPECLSRQAGILDDPANSSVVLAVCGRDVIDGGNHVIWQRRSRRFNRGAVKGSKLIRDSVRWGTNLIGEPAVGLFRRQALDRIGPLDAQNPYLLDLALWSELLKHGDAFIDPICLAAFRISGDSASADAGWRQAAFFRSFVRMLRRDPFYRLNIVDSMLGCGFSFPCCVLRNMFIHSHLKPA